MLYLPIAQLLSLLLSLLLDLFVVRRRSERHKDLQILLLRHQLQVLQRQHPQKPNFSRWDKLIVAVLAAKLELPLAAPRSSWGRCCCCSSRILSSLTLS